MLRPRCAPAELSWPLDLAFAPKIAEFAAPLIGRPPPVHLGNSCRPGRAGALSAARPLLSGSTLKTAACCGTQAVFNGGRALVDAPGGVACSPPSRDQPNDDRRETRIQGVNLSPCCPPDLSPHLLGNQSRQILLKPHRKHWGEQLNGNLVQRSIASAARQRHLSAWGDLSRYSFGRAR